ncbi:MAG TPA: hypothetical protein VNY29_04610 [Terriglobales bacterium]|nr:hypothetical protein [Terriglobales bacterium]
MKWKRPQNGCDGRPCSTRGAAAAHQFQRDGLRPAILVTASDPLFDQVKTTAHVTGQFMQSRSRREAFGFRHTISGREIQVLHQTIVLIIKMDVPVCMRGVLR